MIWGAPFPLLYEVIICWAGTGFALSWTRAHKSRGWAAEDSGSSSPEGEKWKVREKSLFDLLYFI